VPGCRLTRLAADKNQGLDSVRPTPREGAGIHRPIAMHRHLMQKSRFTQKQFTHARALARAGDVRVSRSRRAAGMWTNRVLLCASILLAISGCSDPEIRAYEAPEKTAWAPLGIRPPPAAVDVPVLGDRNRFRTFHGDVLNADEVEIVFAPMFEAGWVAEREFYIPEGPTFDRTGNIYFVPSNPIERVLVVSIDLDGHRRWVVPGKRPGMGGAPLILNHPEIPGTERIYAGSYDSVFALDTEGNVLWDEPTGLGAPDLSTLLLHNWGLNYHAGSDSVVAVLGDGHVVAHRRLDGKRLTEPHLLPGSPAVNTQPISSAIIRAVLNLTQLMGGSGSTGLTDPSNGDPADIVDAIMGAGTVVSNYFSIDPGTGRIWIASTAPDAHDGREDGLSENGALYALQLRESGGLWSFQEHCRYVFQGGSSSTPALRADGERIYVGDDTTYLFAIDADCNEVWRIDIQEKLLASVAVASDNGELYGITGTTVKKVVDRGDHATLEWSATMDMYEGAPTANLSTAGIGANGVMVHIGSGRLSGGTVFPKKVGLALLDRDTGVARFATEGVQESIAAMTTNVDGGVYLAHSPVRTRLTPGGAGRSNGRTIGGIGQYRPIRFDLMARDAVCAAAARAANAGRHGSMPERSNRAERRQLGALIDQTRSALDRAEAAGELDAVRRNSLLRVVALAEPAVREARFVPAAALLSSACAIFD